MTYNIKECKINLQCLHIESALKVSLLRWNTAPKCIIFFYKSLFLQVLEMSLSTHYINPFYQPTHTIVCDYGLCIYILWLISFLPPFFLPLRKCVCFKIKRLMLFWVRFISALCNITRLKRAVFALGFLSLELPCSM